MALAAIALTGMLVAILAHGARIAAAVTARPLTGRAAALREKSWSAAFQRHRDPNAAGRPRPRAPSAVPAAPRRSACPKPPPGRLGLPCCPPPRARGPDGLALAGAAPSPMSSS